jgi:hypothetical protein
MTIARVRPYRRILLGVAVLVAVGCASAPPIYADSAVTLPVAATSSNKPLYVVGFALAAIVFGLAAGLASLARSRRRNERSDDEA